MNPYLLIALVTLIPALELRASIPYGILAFQIPWWHVFIVAIVTNAILGPVVYLLIDKVVHLFLHIGWVKRLYTVYVLRTQKRIHGYVERWGEPGIALFIGVPLPGSGSYTGAMAAYLLGLSHRKFMVANLIGVLIAGIVVTAIVLSGDAVGIFSLFTKTI